MVRRGVGDTPTFPVSGGTPLLRLPAPSSHSASARGAGTGCSSHVHELQIPHGPGRRTASLGLYALTDVPNAAAQPAAGAAAIAAADGTVETARAAWQQGDFDRTLVALTNVAVILTDSDPRQAVALAERADAQAPREPQVLDTYGAALLAAGDTEQALKLLTRILHQPQRARHGRRPRRSGHRGLGLRRCAESLWRRVRPGDPRRLVEW
jgi:hypothetical protein